MITYILWPKIFVNIKVESCVLSFHVSQSDVYDN